MFLITNMLESLGLVIGSLVAAGLACWLASGVAIRLHHQKWAALLMLLLLLILYLSGLTRSGFIRLSAIYGLFGVLFLWFSARNESPRSENPQQELK